MTAAGTNRSAHHVPVLLRPVLAALAPLEGATVLDGTFGAGGYSLALLEAGVGHILALDRDPAAIAAGQAIVTASGGRLVLVEAEFAELDRVATELGAQPLDAVVLDIGVSSMQLDQAERGFSFLRDGPLDMRMGGAGSSAAELVASASEALLADILYHFGEERAARRIARALVAARAEAVIETTGRLAEIVAGCLPPQRPGQPHPATRSFQAIRIAVNDELGQLAAALMAAERALAAGGRLAVVTFHSLEDRIVKRYLQLASGRGPGRSRHMPQAEEQAPRYARPAPAVTPNAAEIAENPRARSARLRAAVRTDAPAQPVDASALGLPQIHGFSREGFA
ncbi:MAG: 16S rRNA (cytosine(1402)-N(4))-methyltransferase RsmH [Pikeienuella sp.]